MILLSRYLGVFVLGLTPAFGQAVIVVPTDQPTIQAGIDAAESGDIVQVLPGTYFENIQLAEEVSVVGSGWENTIVDGGGIHDVITGTSVHRVHIEGLTIRNSGQGNISPGNVGVRIDGMALDFVIGATIRDCAIEGNGFGVIVWNVGSGDFLIDRTVISGNIFNGFCPGLGDVVVNQSTIAANGASGIFENVGANLSVLNSIIAFNGDFGIRQSVGATQFIQYNNVFGNSLGNYWQGTLSGGAVFVPSPAIGELALDPQFRSVTGGDLTLRTGSPCIDAGDPGAPADGDGSLPDMGALSFHGLGNPYCLTNANSTGRPARIAAFGSLSLLANDVLLQCEPVPVNESGIFFYGADAAEVPFGNGYRCINTSAGEVGRLPVIHSTQAEGFYYLLDLQSVGSGPVLSAGSTWFFQCWFRDPQGAGSGFNLSGGLALSFVP